MEEGAFYSCASLKEFTFPQAMKKIAENTFYKCNSLKNIVIPETITEVEYGAFRACMGLEKMTFMGKQTKMAKTAIGDYYFEVDDNNKLEGVGNLIIACYEDSVIYNNYIDYYEDIENVNVEKIAQTAQ